MQTKYTALIALLIAGFLTGCAQVSTPAEISWKEQLNSNLAVLGARNWVVIAESSYPSYTGAGVTTITTEQSSPEVFLQVLDSLERGGYVQPRIMVCSELGNIEESYAPGIKKFRNQINKLLPGRLHYQLPSRIINGQVETATKNFKVLVIKTSTALPYSNIYIELDSGYWNTESETALRAKIEGATAPVPNNSGKTPENMPATVNPPANSPTKSPAGIPPTNSLPTLPKEADNSTPQQPSKTTSSDSSPLPGMSPNFA